MNVTGKFLKVWKKKVNDNGFVKLDLGDSRRDKDGNYVNWTWFDCAIVGNAKNVNVNEGDKIEVKSGIISKRKYMDKWYDDMVIFEMEVMQNSPSQAPQAPSQAQNVGKILGAHNPQNVPSASFEDESIPF